MITATMDPSSSFDYYSQPGYRGNLSPSQSRALFQLWRRFLRLCDSSNHATAPPASFRPARPFHRAAASEPYPISTASSASASASRDTLPVHHASPDPDCYHHHHADLAAFNHGAAASADKQGGLPPVDDKLKDHLRSLEESKGMHDFLRLHGGAALRREFWAMVKGEHPDAVMLRFLRARKWSVDRALAAIGSTCAFRVQHNVSQLVKRGELGLVQTRGGMNIFRNGISYIAGATDAGEPIYLIEVGSHYSSNQTAEELKNSVIYMQEVLSLMMPPPVEKKVVIFNLNNFGLRNMDWSIVLFMAKTMENFYPETLARIYVHGAPWIFKPIWSILRPLLDPLVRDKVHLTWKVDEMAEHVSADRLPSDTLHGNLDFRFEFPEPDAGENDVQKDAATHAELESAYQDVVAEFESATRALARSYAAASDDRQRSIGAFLGGKLARGRRASSGSDGEGGGRGGGDGGDSAEPSGDGDEEREDEGTANLRAMRDVLATKLRVAWLRLKPYVVGKTKYDRWGVVQDDGTIRWRYKTVSGRVDHQVLGAGTSLAALETALEQIALPRFTARAVPCDAQRSKHKPDEAAQVKPALPRSQPQGCIAATGQQAQEAVAAKRDGKENQGIPLHPLDPRYQPTQIKS
ncbi:hypothetical protein ACQY0O_004840 [Thecaphora frezii]